MNELGPKELVVVAVWLAVSLACLLRRIPGKTSPRQRFIDKARENGCYTTASRVGISIKHGDHSSGDPAKRHDMGYCVFRYTVDGKSYEKNVAIWSKSLMGGGYPYEVTMYYDPKKPKKAYCIYDVENNTYQGCGCVFCILSGYAAAFVTNIILSFLWK